MTFGRRPALCPTSWTLIRDRLKSWADPDGTGGTSEATRLGQEAAVCGGGGAGNDIECLRRTIVVLHPRPRIPWCLRGGGKTERAKFLQREGGGRGGGDNNSLKLRDAGRLEKQKLTLDTETD